MIKARKVTDISARSWSDDATVRESVQKGDFEITKDEATGQRQFWFKCPGNCGQVAPLALRPLAAGYEKFQSWEFDGNEAAPTLSPSINHVGRWHGWLRGGIFSVT